MRKVGLCVLVSFFVSWPSFIGATPLLYDEFEKPDGSRVNSEVWHIPTWKGDGDGTYICRTQFRVSQNSPLPSIANGNAIILLETYNPTGEPPGESFYGTDLISNDLFSAQRGLHITVRAKMDAPAPGGIVGGIFLYALKAGSSTYHDEIDFELITNIPDRVQTNIYSNEPLGVGHPVFVDLPVGTIYDYHTYEIKWEPTRVSWFIDGKLVRTEEEHVPTGPMNLHLNIFDGCWPEAYDPNLKYTNDPSENQKFSMSIDSVTVDDYMDDCSLIANTDQSDGEGDACDDIILDFGPSFGVWTRLNNNSWMQLHPLSPETFATGDMDGNGLDEVILDFGPTHGIWVYANNTSWFKLHPLSPDSLTVGDMDGNGFDDVILDFGPTHGTWIRRNDISWMKLHPLSPQDLVTGDTDGNGLDEVILDFGPTHGTWVYANDASWSQLHPLSPTVIETGDMDGNGLDEIIFGFGPAHGTWIRFNNSSWTKLHPLSPEDLTTGDMDGNGLDEVILDFGPTHGTWVRMNNTSWSQLHTLSSESLATGAMDANDIADIVLGYGADHGTWVRWNNGIWSKLHPLSAEDVDSGNIDGL